MTANWHVISLVLACITGWTLAMFGVLPVVVLRQHSYQPLVGVGAWILVAALAPPAVFHWYLIFAIFCFIAWTKIDRPAGKFFLALAAALGLSLGIIFPLEISPPLFTREHPYALGSLYLGGATTALAYTLFATCRGGAIEGWRPIGIAKNFIVVALGWNVWIAARPLLAQNFAIVPPQEFSSDNARHSVIAAEFGIGMLLVILGLLAFASVQRNVMSRAAILALGAIPVALAQTLLIQFSDSPTAL